MKTGLGINTISITYKKLLQKCEKKFRDLTHENVFDILKKIRLQTRFSYPGGDEG
jgi:hypothetical protein